MVQHSWGKLGIILYHIILYHAITASLLENFLWRPFLHFSEPLWLKKER